VASREQFLDFEHFAEIKSTLIKSVKRLPGTSGPITKGEKLIVNFGMESTVTILVRTSTPSQLQII
jgi:hypothetical protein